VEKSTTDIARRFDVIRIEDLRLTQMVKSAKGTVESPGRKVAQRRGLSRAISQQCLGLIGQRLHDKAPGRVEKVNPRHTSQRCSSCGHIDPKSRESQARFRCVACAHTANADVNAAKNIAAGRAVAGRGDISKGEPASAGAALSTKRQPQLIPSG
jgi:transposase